MSSLTAPRTLVALIGGLTAIAGCSLPPFTTAESTFAVKYSLFVPELATALPAVPIGVPGFNDQKAEPTKIPIPKEAHSVQISTVVLNLKLQNTGPIPLRIKLFLSGESTDPYTTAPLGGDQAQIDLPRDGVEVKRELSIDPALLKENAVKLGYTFGSPGTDQPVKFKDTDQVNITQSIRLQAKVF